MRLTYLAAATALLAGSAVAKVELPRPAISSSSVKIAPSSGWITTSKTTKSMKDKTTETTRQHVVTAWITDITTISELVKDVTITKTEHETAIISKISDPPYPTIVPGTHKHQPKHSMPCVGIACGILPPIPTPSTFVSPSLSTIYLQPPCESSQSTSTSLPDKSSTSCINPPLCNGDPCGPKTTGDETNPWVTISRTDATLTHTAPLSSSQAEFTTTESFWISTRTISRSDVTTTQTITFTPPPAPLESASRTGVLGNQLKRSATSTNTNPTSELASWVAATNLWPSGVSPFMVPTATPPATAMCWSSVEFAFEIYRQNHTNNFKYDPATLKNRAELQMNNFFTSTTNDPLTMSLINGTLIDDQDRIGDIVANGQFQFDGPPQAGTIYDAGWSLCNPDDTAYRLTLGANMTFWECNSGNFSNIYAWPLTAECTEIDLLILEQAPLQTVMGSVLGSTTAPLNARAPLPTPAPNQWAQTVEINGKKYTVYDPYPIVTVSGKTYSAQPVTAYLPVEIQKRDIDTDTPSAPSATGADDSPGHPSIQKRDINNDMPVPLNYEYNTYTYTIPAETGIDPSYSDSPEITWTLPHRVITVTEAPFTLTTAASVAARDDSPISSTTITFMAGGQWSTLTLLVPPYTTTWTWTDTIDHMTLKFTFTDALPTLPTTSSEDAEIKARETQELSVVTQIGSIALTTEYVIPEPSLSETSSPTTIWAVVLNTSSISTTAILVDTSSISTTAILLDTSSISTTEVTGSFTSTTLAAASTTSQVSGATTAVTEADGVFYVAIFMAAFSVGIAFWL